MSKFYGKVGYADVVDAGVGVHKPIVTERNHRGDVVRNAKSFDSSDKVNDDLRVSNSISIVADAYAMNHFHDILYVVWQGALWKVTDVEVQSPRLLLRMGGVYSGPKG
jgi:hypothetical protein